MLAVNVIDGSPSGKKKDYSMLGNTAEWPRWDQRLIAPEISQAQYALSN